MKATLEIKISHFNQQAQKPINTHYHIFKVLFNITLLPFFLADPSLDLSITNILRVCECSTQYTISLPTLTSDIKFMDQSLSTTQK